MRNIIINICMAIIWLLFIGGMFVLILPLLLVELGFWIVCDTKLGWLYKSVWQARKALRFR